MRREEAERSVQLMREKCQNVKVRRELPEMDNYIIPLQGWPTLKVRYLMVPLTLYGTGIYGPPHVHIVPHMYILMVSLTLYGTGNACSPHMYDMVFSGQLRKSPLHVLKTPSNAA